MALIPTMGLQDDIDQFCGYFFGQIETIRDLQLKANEERDWSQNQTRFYRKVLLVNAVDTLSGIRFSKDRYPQLYRHNQERFTRFLREGGCWPAGEYVSIPFLADRRSSGELSAGRLRDLVDQKLAKVSAQAGNWIEFSEIDESLEALVELATTEQEERALHECQHYQLLYRYRNYLVHGSREPGKSMEISPDRAAPYYHGYVDESKLYLAYPELMFIQVLEEAVDYIKRYLEQNELNPYDFVEETSR